MSERDDTVVCPVCKTRNRKNKFRCRQCGETLPAGKIDHEQIRLKQFAGHPSHIEPDESYDAEFGSANAISQVALIAVCIGLSWAYPGIGIAVSIISLPVLIHSFRTPGATQSSLGYFAIALLGLGIIILTPFIAFFIVCYPILKELSGPP